MNEKSFFAFKHHKSLHGSSFSSHCTPKPCSLVRLLVGMGQRESRREHSGNCAAISFFSHYLEKAATASFGGESANFSFTARCPVFSKSALETTLLLFTWLGM